MMKSENIPFFLNISKGYLFSKKLVFPFLHFFLILESTQLELEDCNSLVIPMM